MRHCLLLLCFAPFAQATELPNGAVLRLGSEAFRTSDNMYCSTISADGKLVAAGTTAHKQHPYLYVFDARTGELVQRMNARGHVVREVSISRDNRWLAAANGDGSLTLHDLSTGKEVWQVKESGSDCALILPDGQTVATERSSTLLLVNLKDGTIRKHLKHHSKRIHVMAVSDKGDLLACASEDGTVSVWDVAKEELKYTFPVNDRYALGLAFSPDGKRLAAGNYNGSHIAWDLPNNKQLWHSLPKDNNHAGGPLTFSPDGSEVIGLREGGKIYDAVTGKVKGTPEGLPSHHHVGVSADRKVFAPVFNDHTVRLVDIASGKIVNDISGHIHPPAAVVFAEGGKAVYTGNREGLLRWDSSMGKLTKRLDQPVETLATSPDGYFLAALDWAQGRTALLNIRQEKWTTKGTLPMIVIGSARYADRHIHSTATDIFVDVLTGFECYTWDKGKSTLKPYSSGLPDGTVVERLYGTQFAITPDGKQALIAGNGPKGSQLVWWDLVAGKVIHTKLHGKPLESTPPVRIGSEPPLPRDALDTPAAPRVFLPDGKRYIAESEAGILLMHADGERDRVLCERGVLTTRHVTGAGGFVLDRVPLALSHDGRLLAVGRDFGIHLVEVATGITRRKYSTGEQVRGLVFAPDGLRFASIGEGCSTLIWDAYGSAPETSPLPNVAECTKLLETNKGDDVQQILGQLKKSPTMLLALARNVEPAKRGDVAQVQTWLKDLDAERYVVRETSHKKLTEIDTDLIPLVEEHLKTAKLSPEARTRTEKVRDELRKRPLTPERRRQVRLLELLEQLNTPDARQEVERLSKGIEGTALTTYAAETLKRMATPRLP